MEGGAPKGRRLESPRYEREYEESVLSYRHPERSEKSLPFAVRDSRFPHMCRALLRFPHLSFMPLEPYPARYARHLPHAGKALSIVILFPHMCVLALTLWGKRYSRIVAFPAWERGTAPAVDRVLSLTAHLRRTFHLFHLSFIPPVPYPPLRGTFPSRGRLTIREYRHLKCGEAAT